MTLSLNETNSKCRILPLNIEENTNVTRFSNPFNYDTTEEVFVLDKIVGMSGFTHSHWFKVK